MKLLTEEIKKKLPKLYQTELIPEKDKIAVCKFFNPCGAGTWYVIEGEQKEDDFMFFGLAEIHEREFGYFCLSELESVSLSFGLKIERDLFFEETKIANILSGED